MKTLKSRPIAIDLFAGAGGLSLGLEQAGFDVKASVEIDPIHACVHKYNFPDCSVIPMPVEKVTGKMLLESAGLNGVEIDLIAGGAPCQGFSLIGQRAMDDPRNKLVKEFIRLVDELKPKYCLFENVKGLTVGKHKGFLNEIIDELEGVGYKVRMPWKVLNAKHFGVPQNRERLFLIAARNGLELPEYPQPNLDSIVTCEQALSDIPDAELYKELITGDEVSFEYTKKASGYSAIMRASNTAAWYKGYKRKWDNSVLTSSMRTDHTEISRDRFRNTPEGKNEPTSRLFKLPRDGVSNTLRAGTDSARGAFTSPRPIHFDFARCITVREMARLHGFPDWFRFNETKWHGARQVGNAVPPPLARCIGEKILETISLDVTAPTGNIALGDPCLLKKDMSAACKYWGVENPIGKRDRKSGAKKRKQSETV